MNETLQVGQTILQRGETEPVLVVREIKADEVILEVLRPIAPFGISIFVDSAFRQFGLKVTSSIANEGGKVGTKVSIFTTPMKNK